MALRPLGSVGGLLVLALLGLACAGPTVAEKAQRKKEIRARWEVEVSLLEEIGPYRAATLTGRKGSWRLFFPRAGSCEALLRPGAPVVYRFEGPFGVLRGEAGERCTPVGVGSLRAWRDEQPRRRSQYLQPREQARFRTLHRGEGHLLLRGAFPLALEIRWPEPMDSVAVLPATPECEALLGRSKATMAFRASGPDVFVLESEQGPCPIVGLALPLGL